MMRGRVRRAAGWSAPALAAFLIAVGAYNRDVLAPSDPLDSPTVVAVLAAPSPEPPQTPTPIRPPLVLVAGAAWPGPRDLAILMYHHVNSAPPPSDLDARLTVTDADFARQLSYLRCAGYYSITLSQLFDAIYDGAPLPEKPVILTFDDGHLDAYANAFPLLQEAGFGAAFSIVTGWVGQPASANWEQLQQMAAAGMEIASHSVSHPDFGKNSDDVVRDQLDRSKRELEEKLGQPVSFFVYPAGEPFRFGTPQRQAQVMAIVQEAGYRGAVTARWNIQQDPAHPFALSRVRVSGGVDIQNFARNMGGPSPDAIGC